MIRPIRVLQIVGGSKFGGASFVVADIAEMLQKHHCDVTVLATDPQMAVLLNERNVKVWKYEGIQRSINVFKDIAVVLRLAKRLRGQYDIVHTHTSKGGAIGRLAARLARVPIIIHTVHGYAFHEFSNDFTSKLYMFIEKCLSKITDRLIYVNEYDRVNALQKKIAQPEQSITIYNGIPAEKIVENEKSDKIKYLNELGLAESSFLSVFVGRLAKQKGIKYLLGAISRVVAGKDGADFHQVFVGEGELRQEYEAYAKTLGIANHVHFVGFRSDALNWTACADLFVLSSLWEGHSITLLEAMACGKPLIATDIKGNRESIVSQKEGLLVKPADSDALAAAIIRIMADPAFAAELGKNAKNRLLSDFTEEQMLAHVWDLYKEVAAERGIELE